MQARGLVYTWITPVLAVGGRIADLAALAGEVGAVIDLRREDCDDERVLIAHGIAFLHLPTDDLCAVSQPMLRDGVAFATAHLGRGERILVHCEHGIGRSALLALCVLVATGMAPLDALELAKTRRALISPSQAQLEAWMAWLREGGIEPPPFAALAAIAYRHLVAG